MSSPLSSFEAKELIRLCESGRLYEVEVWLAAGKSLTVPKEVRKTPLRVAISTGFHGLVELLLRYELRQGEKFQGSHASGSSFLTAIRGLPQEDWRSSSAPALGRLD